MAHLLLTYEVGKNETKTAAHHCEISPEDKKKKGRDSENFQKRKTDLQGFRLFNFNPGN